MTRAEVKELLNKLDLSRKLDEYDIYDRLDNLGYKRPQVRVRNGATKICLVFEKADFIVKWSYDCDDDNDEGLKECRLYALAVEAGLAFFFPKTEVLGKWGDVSVVIQDKIDYSVNDCNYETRCIYQKIGRTVTDRIFYKMENGFHTGYYDRSLNETWGKLVISLYGKKITKKLCEFIQEYNINDLHESNIGYKDNKPIILDFGGYHR